MNSLVLKKAIDFTTSALLPGGNIVNDYNFFENINGKFCLLFFYPMDFTFVCPTELISINNRISEFKNRNVEVITVSVDSHYVHKAWSNVPIELGGIGKNINFTMVSDLKKDISISYNVLDDKSGVSLRGTFIIDDDKLIKISHVNDFSIGRNIDEYIRLFDAIFFNKKYGDVCQAGWKPGDIGINPSIDGVSKYLKENYKKL